MIKDLMSLEEFSERYLKPALDRLAQQDIQAIDKYLSFNKTIKDFNDPIGPSEGRISVGRRQE